MNRRHISINYSRKGSPPPIATSIYNHISAQHYHYPITTLYVKKSPISPIIAVTRTFLKQ